MIYIDEKTNLLHIENVLITDPEQFIFNLSNFDCKKIEGVNFKNNTFCNYTVYVRPNVFHKLLMKLRLLPKSTLLLKMEQPPQLSVNIND